MRRISLCWAAAIPLALIGPATLAAQPPKTVNITMDLAHLMRMDSPISTVIIGNPDIANASVQDQHTLLLTGRGLGITNMMVFDKTGKQISNSLLRVVPQHAHRVIVQYDSTSQNTFVCLPACSQVTPTKAPETPAEK